MSDHQFEDVIRAQLDGMSKDLADLRDLVRGRPEFGWPGVVLRIENSERQIAALKEVQDGFIRTREQEQKARDAKDKVRTRLQVAVLGVFGSVLSGILIQLFVVLSQLGPTP